eukprot:Lithocolla_globosa_v1_NODE_4444_length_1433_cov_3.379536.p1 type:complete len:292 gc:universal NODE_4444_length_1433_cov_3.379536:1024-149(-)
MLNRLRGFLLSPSGNGGLTIVTMFWNRINTTIDDMICISDIELQLNLAMDLKKIQKELVEIKPYLQKADQGSNVAFMLGFILHEYVCQLVTEREHWLTLLSQFKPNGIVVRVDSGPFGVDKRLAHYCDEKPMSISITKAKSVLINKGDTKQSRYEFPRGLNWTNLFDVAFDGVIKGGVLNIAKGKKSTTPNKVPEDLLEWVNRVHPDWLLSATGSGSFDASTFARTVIGKYYPDVIGTSNVEYHGLLIDGASCHGTKLAATTSLSVGLASVCVTLADTSKFLAPSEVLTST